MSDHELREFARLKQENDRLSRLVEERNGKGMAEKLKLNIGTVITILLMGGGSLWAVQGKLTAIEAKIDSASADRWRASYMREWTHRLSAENIGKLSVPSSDTVKRDIEGIP